jgi:hypothetical protein
MFVSGGIPLAVCLAVMLTPTYALASNHDAADVFKVQIRDDCDPATFNLPPPRGVGPGTCVGNGDVTFARFLDQVGKLKRAPEWRFSPAKLNMRAGDTFVATNKGGELHSFTELEKFGGGIVPFLNDLAGSGATVPECGAAAATIGQPGSSFVFPGQSFTEIEGPNPTPRTDLYQCCIHPWMHAAITVRPAEKN